MRNHYRNHADKLPSWRGYIGWSLKLPEGPFAEDVYPKRKWLVIRREAGATVADVMSWGIFGRCPASAQARSFSSR